MQDEEKKSDDLDDNLDLDLDAEDVDLEDDLDFDDDDFSDLDWEDEEGGIEEDQARPPGTSSSASSRQPTGKRTFLQKNFNAIVIGIVVILAAGWFLLSGGGSDSPEPSQQAAQEQPTVITEEAAAEPKPQEVGLLSNPQLLSDFEDAEGGPPMPAPIAPAEEEVEEEEVAVLTPLPQVEENQERPALISLEEPLNPPTEEEIEETAKPQDIISEEFAPITPETIAAPEIKKEVLPLETLEHTEPEETVALDLYEDLQHEYNAARSDFETERAGLQKEIENKDKEIKALASDLALRQAQIEELKKQQTQKAKVPVKKQPVVKKQKKPVSKPIKAVKKEWILRSAQPGRAIVSDKNSNDLKTVSVGGQLEGIGQITSITIQNGKWVVSGTKGRIIQQ